MTYHDTLKSFREKLRKEEKLELQRSCDHDWNRQVGFSIINGVKHYTYICSKCKATQRRS